MSGLAACWHLDGRPVGPELDRMLDDGAAGPGRDGRGVWRDGPIGLGQLHRATTAEDGGTLLAVDGEAGLVVAVAGRVLQRPTLAARVAPRADERGHARLVLHAYRRDGPDFLRRAPADLAALVWDGHARRLVAVCDHLATRPLVWWTDGRRVLVASGISLLAAHGALRPLVNEALLGEAYANRLVTGGETLVRGVRRVHAGHAVVIDERGRASERPWIDPPDARPAHRDAGEWIEEYRETFAAAVRSATDTARPPSLVLTGDLDSSSVLCVAVDTGCLPAGSDLVTTGAGPGDRPGAGTEAGRALAHAAARPVHRLAPPPGDWSRSVEVTRRLFTLPVRPRAAHHRAVIDRTAADGRSVIVTGEGGDDWLAGLHRFWPDRLARGEIGPVLRAAWARPRPAGLRRAAAAGRALAGDGLLPLLGRRLGRPRPPGAAVPPWITPGFARRVGLDDRLGAWPRTGPLGPAHAARWSERHDRLGIEAADAGVECRHPFHDRRLVELTLALPEELLARRGTTGWILREAVRGIVPEVVAHRPGGQEPSPGLARDLDDLLGTLGGPAGLRDLVGVRRGYLDPGGLDELATRSLACLRAGRRPRGAIEDPANLWAVLAADIWLAVRTSGHPPVPDPGRAGATGAAAGPRPTVPGPPTA